MRLIDADELSKKLSPNYNETKQLIKEGETHLDTLAEGYTEVSILIKDAPTIEAEIVKHGHWIYDESPKTSSYKECSVCRTIFVNVGCTKYCSECGAKMNEVE